MLQTEFLRNLNCNYERILLDKNPEEKRYQYCMISRGGIKGLLPCSLRYINGAAYLYYDITSKQNVEQIYGKRSMTRQWVKDFMWSVQQIREELSRYLLDEQNILWYPRQVYPRIITISGWNTIPARCIRAIICSAPLTVIFARRPYLNTARLPHPLSGLATVLFPSLQARLMTTSL